MPKTQKQAKKTPRRTLTIATISILSVLGGFALASGIYAYGVHQGRLLLADNARNSMVEALNTSQDEAKVDKIVSDIDELNAFHEVNDEAAKAEAPKQEAPVKTPVKSPTETPVVAHEEKKPLRAITVTNPIVSVEVNAVVFSASLPESLVGDCKVFLQRVGDKAGAWHYNKSSSPRTLCVTSIPKNQLAPGTWQYELTFYGENMYGANNPKGSFTI